MNNAARNAQQVTARANAQHHTVHRAFVDRQRQGAEYARHHAAGDIGRESGRSQILIAVLIILFFAAVLGAGAAFVIHERAQFDGQVTKSSRTTGSGDKRPTALLA